MMPREIVANIAAAQGSPLAVAIEVSGHHLFGDEPVSQGGANLGPSPFDLLTAALGECTAITVRWYALQKGWPLEHVNVEVRHKKKMQAGKDEIIDTFRKSISIIGDHLTEDQKDKLFEVAENCPVHKTLTGHIAIETMEI